MIGTKYSIVENSFFAHVSWLLNFYFTKFKSKFIFKAMWSFSLEDSFQRQASPSSSEGETASAKLPVLDSELFGKDWSFLTGIMRAS